MCREYDTEGGFDGRGSMGGSSQAGAQTPTAKHRNSCPRLRAHFIGLLATDSWIFWGSPKDPLSSVNPPQNSGIWGPWNKQLPWLTSPILKLWIHLSSPSKEILENLPMILSWIFHWPTAWFGWSQGLNSHNTYKRKSCFCLKDAQ